MAERSERPSDGIFITAEQLARAPHEVRSWLLHIFGGAAQQRLVLERNGLRSSGDGLAICSALEVKTLLRRLGDDEPACQVLFQLGCDYYDPATGESLPRVLQIMDFVRHTDVTDGIHLLAAIERINAALQRLRNEPSVLLCRPDEHGGFHVHETTQRTIYGIWRRLVRQKATPRGARAA
jgi:hypothetical protein